MEKINIYQAMGQIMNAVEPIRKEKTNTQGAVFKYRGIDDVMNSLHEAFAQAGVFITTEVLNREEKERQSKSGGTLIYVTQLIKFTFHAQDGSSICSTVNGTAMDSGDKADNKSLSIGLKYALLQAFLIPTDDMAEPDSQTHEVKPEPQAKHVLTAEKPLKSKTITDKAVSDAIVRILKGEVDLFDKLNATFDLTPEQKTKLKNVKQSLTIKTPENGNSN